MRRAAVCGAALLMATPLLSGCGRGHEQVGARTITPEPARAEVARTITPEPARVEVELDFDDVGAESGTVLLATVNGGSAAVEVAVATADGGLIVREPGPQGGAVRLPAAEESSESRPPTAAIVVTPAPGSGALSPGATDFEFGADFRLDHVSGTSGTDDGDNLVQRGLFTDPSQLKLQVDHGYVACRVAGPAGEVVVRSSTAVERDWWHRVSCARRGNVVELTVARAIEQDGSTGWTGQPERFSGLGPTGTLVFDPRTPLAIGAKVSVELAVVTSSSDQLNGAIDHVYVDTFG